MIAPNVAYLIINGLVLPAWILLIFAPRSLVTQKWVHAVFYPLLFGLIYLGLISAGIVFGYSNSDAGFSSLEAVQALFAHPVGLLTGWAHYLVFDLFVGAWIARDGFRRDIKHGLIVPCLLFSFLFGPLGLLLYIIIRKATGKGGWSLDEKGV